MTLFGILIIATFAIVGVPATNIHPQTMFCQACHGVRDSTQCTVMHKCHPDESCYTDVRVFQGEYYYFKGCKRDHACGMINNAVLVGKRAPILHENDLLLVCEDCCKTDRCNTIGCDQYSQTTTTTTTTTTTAAPSTQQPATLAPVASSGSTCSDYDENGFDCTDYDQYNFCSETDPTSFLFEISHYKCPKHCGFCMTTTAAPPPTSTSNAICRDHEEDGFICADYDKFNFCSDVSSIAYSIAHEQCPKHCGFCGQSQTGSGSYTAPLTSTYPANRQPLSTTVDISQSQTSTSTRCADLEDATFTCSSWASNGFCMSPTGVLHEITVMRCSKYCGLC